MTLCRCVVECAARARARRRSSPPVVEGHPVDPLSSYVENRETSGVLTGILAGTVLSDVVEEEEPPTYAETEGVLVP